MSASNQQAIDRAARSILSATHLCFLAGAGMGVDGGLPCFRGKEGFWNAYPPMKRLGLEFHQMSTPKWFENVGQLCMISLIVGLIGVCCD